MKTNLEPNTQQASEAKPGFFTRILNKMDSKMKAKADEAAKKQCCGNDKNGKGGKCC
jgi:hypothetical protein